MVAADGIAEVRRQIGRQFDPDVATPFVSMIEGGWATSAAETVPMEALMATGTSRE